MQTKVLSILGSTGSIGTQALSIVDKDPGIRVAALAAGHNIDLLYRQILRFRPQLVCVYEENAAEQLSAMLQDPSLPAEVRNLRIETGMYGLIAAAVCPEADTVLVSVVGMIGIRPTLAAIRAGKKIALANKETLVCAGHLIMPLVSECGTRLMPVDSEHSAIYQCLVGEQDRDVDELLLTASGGPFRGYTKEMLSRVTKEDALHHPNWSMGQKITIDSSTMVNKALEVMEAHWLFHIPVDRIRIVVQPQSIIHSMVRFRDGAVKAQLGVPSMLIPISYALYAPSRRPLPREDRLDFSTLSSLDFSIPDLEVFTGLRLGLLAGERGGSLPTVFNAANEEAVAAFLSDRITYQRIPELIETAMEAHETIAEPSLEEILSVEQEARQCVREAIGN